MSGTKKATRTILVAGAWILIIGILGVAYRYLIHPYFQEELTEATGSSSQYKHVVKVAADSFSGYAILRSPALAGELKSQGIRLEIEDDRADYEARLKALRDEDVDLAVFTVDSLIYAGAKMGEYPASIVMVIDETNGADAIVAYQGAVGSIQDLDSPDARIVLTPSSPSEFLARVVVATFSLPSLPEKWWEEADGAEAVYKEFRKAKGDKGKRAFVLWEPYVSKALDEPGAHVLLDSSKLSGYIVDVLVANRKFLQKHPELVRAVVESYQRAAFSYGRQADGMVKLVMDDAKRTGSDTLSEAQARKLVDGIRWKNTLENYAHLGLQPTKGVQHLEDIIGNIADVLVKTGALDRDPLEGKASTLFYDGTLRDLLAENFHPGKKVNVIQGMGPGTSDLDAVRGAAALPALSDEQWDRIVAVGNMRIDPIAFSRGNARISVRSQRDLDRLSQQLESWPNSYLKVIGHARAEGDPQANRELAKSRAEAAVRHLTSRGVPTTRLRAEVADPSGNGGGSQSVSFILGNLPY
ncbi:hypothetical protein AMJ57_00525 [Parcubacteria bacterium SG8_24]|nr:MAG: hypothetical protein AMJ57_00525 [Parcubacteria bacterium SG8_24]